MVPNIVVLADDDVFSHEVHIACLVESRLHRRNKLSIFHQHISFQGVLQLLVQVIDLKVVNDREVVDKAATGTDIFVSCLFKKLVNYVISF